MNKVMEPLADLSEQITKANSPGAIATGAFFITLLIIGLGTAGYLVVYKMLEDKILIACEDRIIRQLVAPSTYKRVSVSRIEEKLSGMEFKRELLKDDPFCEGTCQGLLGLYDKKKLTPAIYYVRVAYDANNSFNAPVRQTDECSYFSIDGFPSYVFDVNLKFNGRSQMDDLLEQRRQKQNKP